MEVNVCLCVHTCCQSSRSPLHPTRHRNHRRPARRCRLHAPPPRDSTRTPLLGNGRCRTATASRSRGDSWRGRRRTTETQSRSVTAPAFHYGSVSLRVCAHSGCTQHRILSVRVRFGCSMQIQLFVPFFFHILYANQYQPT